MSPEIDFLKSLLGQSNSLGNIFPNIQLLRPLLQLAGSSPFAVSASFCSIASEDCSKTRHMVFQMKPPKLLTRGQYGLAHTCSACGWLSAMQGYTPDWCLLSYLVDFIPFSLELPSPGCAMSFLRFLAGQSLQLARCL